MSADMYFGLAFFALTMGVTFKSTWVVAASKGWPGLTGWGYLIVGSVLLATSMQLVKYGVLEMLKVPQ